MNWFRTVVLGGLLSVAGVARGDLLDDIGFTAIPGRSGPPAPDGGVAVAQVEVPEAGGYVPDTAGDNFAGKTFTVRSGTSTPSAHAGMVAGVFYGNLTSPGQSVTSVSLYSAEGFVSSLLRTGNNRRAPGGAGASVINNSWVAAFGTQASNVEAVRRLDDLIARDDVLVFNAVKNANDGSFPKLLATSYNGITVGTLSGSRGPVTFDAQGARIKPDLVVDTSLTSVASAVSAGSGAFLRSTAQANSMRANQLSIKAMLMAGAERDATWRRGRPSGSDNATAPLDFAQGAGKLRVDRAHQILVTGQGLQNSSIEPYAGWDAGRAPRGSTTATYLMRVEETMPAWSAFLTWNRVIAGMRDGQYDSTPVLADFDLALYLSKRGGRRLVAYSDSAHDNVESLTVADLAPGDYQVVLTSDIRTNYGLAWYGEDPFVEDVLTPSPTPLGVTGGGLSEGAWTAVPEPTGLLVLGLFGALGMPRRRRITR